MSQASTSVPRKGPRLAPPVSGPLFLGLLAIFWLEYLRPGNYVSAIDAIKLNTIIPLAVALATFFAREGRPNEQVFRARDTKLFLFLLLMFGVQMFVVDVRLYVFEILKGFVGYLLLYYILVRQVTTLHRLKVVMVTLVLVHVVTLTLYPDVVLDPESRHWLGGSFLGDGNDFAWSVCVAIPFTLFVASTSDRQSVRFLFYGIFVLLILAVIGTQSRGGSLALLGVISYLALKSRERGLAFAGIGALVVIVLLFAPSAYFDRMDTIAQWQSEGSAQGRILAWQSATRMALDHPITGVGAGHYVVKFGFEYKPEGYHGPYLNTHSIYFTMLAEFGFPGLIALASLIVGNLLRNRRMQQALRRRAAPMDHVNGKLITAMQASLIGFTVAGAFLSGVFYPHIFVLAGLMESARQIARTRSSQPAVTASVDAGVQTPARTPWRGA